MNANNGRLNPRKLRLYDSAPVENGWSSSPEWVTRLVGDLHAPDGILFVPDVQALLRAGHLPTEPWAGVIHPEGDRSAARSLSRMEADPAFREALGNCRGLWLNGANGDMHSATETAASIPTSSLRLPETGEDVEAYADYFANTAVYRALQVPRTQAADLFRRHDLTVMLCSYKRVHNIGPILEAFCNQTYTGTFEVLIWNNNIDAAAELEEAVRPYRDRLDLTLIHSERNYYCIVRLAVAHLMRGDHLMICDDDVRPGPRYLERFVGGLSEAGEKAIICARGNTFRPHTLNRESPEGVWERWENLDFWDVGAPPREIHFMHGSNCLVPKEALLELSRLELPRREFILVDDYWLSYALSGLLGWKLWKIEATDAFQFDASAEDPEVALWLNRRVQDERTNFYVYHMTHGWPEGCSA